MPKPVPGDIPRKGRICLPASKSLLHYSIYFISFHCRDRQALDADQGALLGSACGHHPVQRQAHPGNHDRSPEPLSSTASAGTSRRYSWPALQRTAWMCSASARSPPERRLRSCTPGMHLGGKDQLSGTAPPTGRPSPAASTSTGTETSSPSRGSTSTPRSSARWTATSQRRWTSTLTSRRKAGRCSSQAHGLSANAKDNLPSPRANLKVSHQLPIFLRKEPFVSARTRRTSRRSGWRSSQELGEGEQGLRYAQKREQRVGKRRFNRPNGW